MAVITHDNMNVAAKNRVPHIIFLYWVIKIASTTLGETGADMLSMTFKLGYAQTILIFMSLFLVLLGIKLFLKGYYPVIYWLVFTASALVGTGISDFIDRTLGLGYALGSAVLIAMLLITLAVWYKKEKSVHVDHITTSTAEIFYWVAFLFANTLGTAAGDFVADNLGLGFAYAAVLFSVSLIIISLAYFFTRISRVWLFWLAFVLTRPFGATFGDLLTKSVAKGGLNLGTVGSSIFFCVILIFAVAKETRLERFRN